MNPKTKILSICGTAVLVLAAAGCTADRVDADAKDANAAEAQLKDASGSQVGTAYLTESEDGVNVRLTVSNLPSGSMALHIHENGKCEPPKFESAGSHFNPTNQAHGFDAEGGPHLGDLRNISVGQDGKTAVNQFAKGISLGGSHSVVGKALVIHNKPDDYHTQPSGAAGDRLACGVIESK